MSKSSCEKSQMKKGQGRCEGSGECCTILCGDNAQQYSDESASCVINCKNQGDCCTKGTGCVIKCKGKGGTCCEINCGCCSIAVEKNEDSNGPCCKITCCSDKEEDKKECVLTCKNKGASADGKYCVIKCGGKTCCIIKC